MTRRSARSWTGAICRTVAVVAIASAGPTALAQQPSPPAPPDQAVAPPAFKTGVEIVVLDVTVLDASGRPVRDLRAQDFDVRVDGKPRKTVSADVLEFTAAAGASPEPPPRHDDFSTNEGRPPGRAVVLVMDLASFRPGEERVAVLSASAFLDTLSSSDVVAVTQLPWLSSSLAFTADRERQKKALVSSMGMKQPRLGTTTLGVAETMRATRGDTYAWRQIVLRECRVLALQPVPSAPAAACSAPGYEPECPCLVQDRLRSEVQVYANEIRIDTDRQLQGLLDLLTTLRTFTGPKLVVVVSQGIVLDDLGFSRALAATAGLANARVHVLRPEMSLMDASSGQAVQQRSEDIRIAQDGLDTLAGMLGGRVYPAIGDPQRQFVRIWQENAAIWRLGVDPDASDLDGKPHRLEVRVRRPGLSVLARSSFLPDPTARDADTPAGRLRDALFSPVQATALPVRVTHYVTPSRDGAIQVRIVGEIDGVPAKADPPAVAFVVVDDERGKQVAGGAGRVADEPDGVHPSVFSTVAKLTAGRYTIKLAASAADGRVGSVERHVELAAPPENALAIGDLLLAERTSDRATTMAPSVRPTVTNGQMMVYAEVAPVAGSAPGPLELHVARDAGQPLLAQFPVAVKVAPSGNLSAVSAVVSVLHLGDGEYVARLVTSSSPQVGTGWRTFRVATDAATVVGNLTTALPFDRRSVLEGDLLARILAELSDRPAAADPAIAAALKDVAAGQFPAAEAPLGSEEDPATPAMIRGFGLLANGRLDDAATEFKGALRDAPDLSLALVYVGSCFAAGGLDREAAGAWQTALIEEKRVPVLYVLLADAWLRLNDPARALEVLTRATARWPGDVDLNRRRAVALARAGKQPDALSEVDALLARAPDDAATACVGFRIAVDRSGAGRVDEEKTRRYATACASGGAPESPLAAGWLKNAGKKRR